MLVVHTTSGVAPRTFATNVFNAWGVGHAGRDDGVRFFLVTQDRKAEIILGDGCGLTSTQSDAVMRDDVVANMKRGTLDAALTEAAQALASLLRRTNTGGRGAVQDSTGLGPAVRTLAPQPGENPGLVAYLRGEKAFPESSPRSWVVDPTDTLTAQQRAEFDVAANDVYTAGKGRVFFLVARRPLRYPSSSGSPRG